MEFPLQEVLDAITPQTRAAGVPFIGIAAPSNPRYIDLVFLFQEEGAYAIVDDINFLQEVFTA